MRKAILFLLILVMIMTFSLTAFADMEDIIENHWSKSLIEKDFFLYYFPYLAKENFKRFEPNGIMQKNEFLLSFSSLLKDNGYSNVAIGNNTDLTRGEMAKIIGEKLVDIKLISSGLGELPFTDIKDIPIGEQNAIKALYRSGIIQGETKTTYNSKRNVTQAEAIIVLQKIDKLFEQVASFPYELLGVAQTYSGERGITTKIKEDKVLVTITEEFPTPGYSVEMNGIKRSKGKYIIHLNVIPPKEESDQLQVITYKTITIEIDKEKLGDPPYNFVLGDCFYLK